MVVVTIDERDVHIGAPKRARREEAAEAAPENDHVR